MSTDTYNRLTDQEKREVRMYGCTEAEMREAVEQSITYRFSGPAFENYRENYRWKISSVEQFAKEKSDHRINRNRSHQYSQSL